MDKNTVIIHLNHLFSIIRKQANLALKCPNDEEPFTDWINLTDSLIDAYINAIYHMIYTTRGIKGSRGEFVLFSELCHNFAFGFYEDSSAAKLYSLCETDLCEAYVKYMDSLNAWF